MNAMLQSFETQLSTWLLRKTLRAGARRVGELGVVIGTDIGLVREENQDRVVTIRFGSRSQEYLITVLADGMGGMADGAVCAAMAISSFCTSCLDNTGRPLAKMATIAAHQANMAVHNVFRGSGGATLSALISDSSGCMIAVNIGDSRIYGYSKGKLAQLSRDDTVSGQLDGKKLNENPMRNDLLQYVGLGAGLEPHLIDISSTFDNVLLTSDGIHFLDHGTMEKIAYFSNDSGLTVKRLTDLAKWCGGHDNASAAIITKSPFSREESNVEPMSKHSVKVWDPFGEILLMFIVPERPIEKQREQPSNSIVESAQAPDVHVDNPSTSPIAPSNSPDAALQSVNGTTTSSKSPPSTKSKKNKKNNSPKSKNNKSRAKAAPHQRPQLLIDFIDDESAKR